MPWGILLNTSFLLQNRKSFCKEWQPLTVKSQGSRILCLMVDFETQQPWESIQHCSYETVIFCFFFTFIFVRRDIIFMDLIPGKCSTVPEFWKYYYGSDSSQWPFSKCQWTELCESTTICLFHDESCSVFSVMPE